MKIKLLAICLFSSLLLKAQIKKGALFIGGDISFYKYKNTNLDPNQYTVENSAFTFSPSIGWAVKENLVAGGRGLISIYNNEQQISPSFDKSRRFGAGVFVRKYMPLVKSLYFFGDASLNVQSIYRKQTSQQQPVYYKESGYSIGAAIIPGVAYQVKRCLFLEIALNNLLSLGYERKNTEQQDGNGNNYKAVNTMYNFSTSLGNGIPLLVGMRWMIPKK